MDTVSQHLPTIQFPHSALLVQGRRFRVPEDRLSPLFREIFFNLLNETNSQITKGEENYSGEVVAIGFLERAFAVPILIIIQCSTGRINL